MAKRKTPEQKAVAVARVLAGESRRQVASEFGVSDSTVRGWVAKAEQRDTAQDKDLAKRAQAALEEIEHWQEIARHALIQRLVELAPKSEDLDKVASAYERITKSSLLGRGKATGRTEVIQRDSIDTEIATLLEEMARREHAGNGSGS